MGGDRASSIISSTGGEESTVGLEQEFPEQAIGGLPALLRDDGVGKKKQDDPGIEPLSGGFGDVGGRNSSIPLEIEFSRRRKCSAYREVLRSYDELRLRSQSLDLEEAKRKITSYVPGAWTEKVGGMKLSDYDVPKTTSLLVIGPRGSGKSSLINRISNVFEDDKFASERAQVSYNASIGDGTYYLQEYMVLRGSTSFCLYDTRSFSYDSSENMEMLKHWMTRGVCHGEPVIRDSDNSKLKRRLRCKARQNGYNLTRKMVNFVIFVVNGFSVLKSMEGENEADTLYTETIATMFNCPFWTFKDDKPVIVVTHGDLLSLSDRARIRVHLGEILGIPPKKQIFDIPGSCDPATELAIIDMLRHSLEHADRNIPLKCGLMGKVRPFLQDLPTVYTVSLPARLVLSIILAIVIIFALSNGAYSYHARRHHRPPQSTHIDWHAIRYMWLGSEYD